MKIVKYILIVLSFALFAAQGFTQKIKPELPWKNGKLKVSDNGRCLQHANGKPFFWLGETAWLLPSRTEREEVDYFMTTLKDNGFNVVQISVLHTIPAYNRYGHIALPDGFNFNKMEVPGQYSYWKHVDYIVESAERNGIYAAIVCVWGGPVKAGRMSVEEAKPYARFLAERYKKYPNIVWMIGGDVRGNEKEEVWRALAETIRETDPEHLMTFHPRGRTTSATWFGGEPWMDFHMFQSGHRRYGQGIGDDASPLKENTEEDNWRYIDASRKLDPAKPVIDGEPSYEGIPHGLHDVTERYRQAEDARRYAYWSVFGGAFGHTYGHNSTIQMYRHGYPPAYGATVPWWESIKAPGATQMNFLKKLILAFPFFERIPDQSVIRNNGDCYDRIAAARGKDYILAYNYTNRPMEVDVSKISGKKKKAWWYNPVDGSIEFIGEYADGIHTFVHTSNYRAGNDRVLIITDATAGYVERNLAN